MPNMSVLLSEYPRVSVPSLESITNGPVRAAVAERLKVMSEVLAAHDINGRIRSGQPVPPDMSHEELARLVLISGDADTRIAESVEKYHEALNQNRDTWKADAQTGLGKAKDKAVKALRAALTAMAEYEVTAGTVTMLDTDTAELKWRPPAEVFELHAAVQPMQALVDKLTTEEQA